MALIIRRFSADEWREYRDLRLRALASSPDAFGSTYDEEVRRSDAQWVTRLAVGAASPLDLPLVAEVDGTRVGLAWGKIEPPALGIAHLYQVWVDPAFRGRGVGGRLVEAIKVWANEAGAFMMHLTVTCGDSSAARLYRRAGFRPAGEPALLRPGSALLEQTMTLDLVSK